MKASKTSRGFDIIEFEDLYHQDCNLQKSSLATEDAIWFGVGDPDPQVPAKLAAQYGVQTNETTGWVKYPIPKDVLLNTRMHLTREQVKELLPVLERFVETGEICAQ